MAERLRRVSTVGWQVFDEKAVLLNVTREKVHELNPTATWLWQRLDGRDTETLLNGWIAEFDVDPQAARSDWESLRAELLSLGVIEICP